MAISEEGLLEHSEGLPEQSLKEVPWSPAAMFKSGLWVAGGHHDEKATVGDGTSPQP